MGTTATLTVISGPDRGKMFGLDAEQVSIGHGEDNDVALTDQSLESHQASIVCREGRFAIFSPVTDSIEVDGRQIPSGRWVWLPETARIRVSDRTSLQFNVAQKDSKAAPKQAPPAKKPRKSKKADGGERTQAAKGKRKRQTARFITDQVGEPLVKLGEDGELPELRLDEGTTQTAKAGQEKKKANPNVLYLALGLSFLMSLAMLFMDFEPRGAHSRSEILQAREGIQEFYGTGDKPLEEYQKLLRAAQRAHSAGDYAAEQRAYRRVLALLNSEENENSIKGVTGDKSSDEILREHLGILITR